MVLLAWGVSLTLLGAWWLLGGAGFPFGRNDATGPENGSLLVELGSTAGGPAVALLGLATWGAARSFTGDPVGWVLFPLWSLSLVLALTGYAFARTQATPRSLS